MSSKARKHVQAPNKPAGSEHIPAPRTTTTTPDKAHYPAFSLRYVANGDFSIAKCQKKQKAALTTTMSKLSQMTWAQIDSCGRHESGYERISHDQIRAQIPDHVTEDVNLVSFRFCGKAPMVGYRDEEVFFILWLDPNFKLYDHGS